MSGFFPVQNISGSPYSGKVQRYAVDATHATLLARGDLIVETGNTDTLTGLSKVDAISAGTGNRILGAIVSIESDYGDLEMEGLPALKAGYVYCSVDPDTLYKVKTSGGTLAANDIGGNLPVDVTAATATGNLVNSNMTVNATGNALATTEQVRVVSIPTSPALASPTYPLAIGSEIIVRINESSIKSTAGV